MEEEFKQFIDRFLAQHCTGQDDHDEPHCRKCEEMRKQLLEYFLPLAPRA